MTESINFVLKTTTISSSLFASDFYNKTVDNVNGTIFNMTNFTWKNVNLRNLLSDLYDKYDSFNIQLISVTHSPRGGTASSNSNVLVQIKMSGLPWYTSYDQSTKMNTGTINLATCKFLTTASVGDSIQFNNNIYYTFNKLYDTTNINIQLHQLDTDALIVYTSNAMVPMHYIFQFSITGCKPTLRENLDNVNKAIVHSSKFPFN